MSSYAGTRSIWMMLMRAVNSSVVALRRHTLVLAESRRSTAFQDRHRVLVGLHRFLVMCRVS
jgi:hypothetical protein